MKPPSASQIRKDCLDKLFNATLTVNSVLDTVQRQPKLRADCVDDATLDLIAAVINLRLAVLGKKLNGK